ncbi:MAG: CinA family protein [Planctomycetaceae bacterium]
MRDLAAGNLLESLADRQVALSLVATGGGTSAIASLCGNPGASRVVMEGLIPYATAAMDRLLGGRQEQYCSARASRRLAITAWQRSVEMTTPERAMGAAGTASLVTARPKVGEHRVHVAVQTLHRTFCASVHLTKGSRDRAAEESLAATFLLSVIGAMLHDDEIHSDACRHRVADGLDLLDGERVETELVVASAGLRGLLAGRSRAIDAESARLTAASHAVPKAPAAGQLLFPGSFDPLHDGHRQMANVAERIVGRPVSFELSVTNVDKPMLDYVELLSRVKAIGSDRALWLTRAATFVEKTEIFRDATFIMGADTFARLADSRYSHGSVAEAAATAERIAGAVRELIVFGRLRDGGWLDPSTADVPESLRRKTRFIPREMFAMDISSTALRARAQGE